MTINLVPPISRAHRQLLSEKPVIYMIWVNRDQYNLISIHIYIRNKYLKDKHVNNQYESWIFFRFLLYIDLNVPSVMTIYDLI